MKTILSGLCASVVALTVTATSFVPAQAAPVFVPQAPAAAPAADNSNVLQVRDVWRRGGWNGNGWRNDGWRGNRNGWRGGNRYYGGRDYYRRDRGRDIGGALIGGAIAGALIGGALNNGYNNGPVYREQRVYRGGNAHVQWCYDRYQTYRASDNTYVPRVGVRAYCNSPFG